MHDTPTLSEGRFILEQPGESSILYQTLFLLQQPGEVVFYIRNSTTNKEGNSGIAVGQMPACLIASVAGFQVAQQWRTGIDMFAVWDAATAKELRLPSFLQSVLGAVHSVEDKAAFAGPGVGSFPIIVPIITITSYDQVFPVFFIFFSASRISGLSQPLASSLIAHHRMQRMVPAT